MRTNSNNNTTKSNWISENPKKIGFILFLLYF